MTGNTTRVSGSIGDAAPFGIEPLSKKNKIYQEDPSAIISFHKQSLFYQQCLKSKTDDPWPLRLKYLQLTLQQSTKNLEKKENSGYLPSHPYPTQPKLILQPPLASSAFCRIHSFSPIEQLKRIADFYISLKRPDNALPHLKLALDIEPNNKKLIKKIQKIEKALLPPQTKVGEKRKKNAPYT